MLNIISLTAIYILLHFSFYVIVVRHIAFFHSERNIFLFHLWSVFILLLLSIIVAFVNTTDFASVIFQIIAVQSIHGIYSLSFLELWSLSQGGYSLNILSMTPIILLQHEKSLQKLELMGSDKFSARLISLQEIGVLYIKNDTVKLTKFGKIITWFMCVITKLTNTVDRG